MPACCHTAYTQRSSSSRGASLCQQQCRYHTGPAPCGRPCCTHSLRLCAVVLLAPHCDAALRYVVVSVANACDSSMLRTRETHSFYSFRCVSVVVKRALRIAFEQNLFSTASQNVPVSNVRILCWATIYRILLEKNEQKCQLRP